MKLHLGCGDKKLDGYLNVDKYGNPDFVCDLEITPWPWETSSVDTIELVHVLEHLGQQTEVYINIIKEMYRVCCDGAKIHIIVPYFRHDNFWNDPTHVRVVTPEGLKLFSKKFNNECKRLGLSNSTLGLYHDVDFEISGSIAYHPAKSWKPKKVTIERLLTDSSKYNNVVEQIELTLVVIKPTPN